MSWRFLKSKLQAVFGEDADHGSKGVTAAATASYPVIYFQHTAKTIQGLAELFNLVLLIASWIYY
jgi:hypothetical protein